MNQRHRFYKTVSITADNAIALDGRAAPDGDLR